MPVFRRAAADSECCPAPAAEWMACLGRVVLRGVRHALLGSAAGSFPWSHSPLGLWLLTCLLFPLLPAEPKARGERAGPAALFGRSGVGRDSRAPQRTPRASVPDPTACAVGSSVVWCPMMSHLAVSWILVPVLTAEHCRQGWRCAHFPVRWFTSRARRAAVGNGAPRPDPTAETPPAGLAGLLGELDVLQPDSAALALPRRPVSEGPRARHTAR